MRWIALSLLAINILALIVQLTVFDGGSAEPVAPVTAPDISQDKRLRLLSELNADAVRTMMNPREPARRAASVQTPSEPMCTLVGPFDALLQAEYLVERLAAREVTARIEELEIPGEIGYWVYLPPRETRRQAFNELREIQAKGIDSYVIPKGELANGISFGMFSQPALAKSRMEDMRSRGYAAEIKETPRIYRETWVVLAPGQSQYLDSAMWQQLLEGSEGVERRQNYCPPVASH